MVVRITIMLDEELLKKLRIKQAKMLKKNNGSVSLSRIINDYLRDAIKKQKFQVSALTEKIICSNCNSEIIQYDHDGYKGKRGRCPICGVDFPLE